MTHEEFNTRIEDQDRRLAEALRALSEMNGSVPDELVAYVQREFERIAELDSSFSTPTVLPAGMRA